MLHTADGRDEQGLSLYKFDWVEKFTDDGDRLANMFTAAGFAANQVWMRNNVHADGVQYLIISYDYGDDSQVSTTSMAVLILISVLFALDSSCCSAWLL